MMRQKIALTVLVISGFHGSFAMAWTMYPFYEGVREMSMGGASVAVVNDETTLMLNPAGLGRLRDHILTIADPEVEASSNLEKVLGTDVLGGVEPQNLLNNLNKNQNSPFHEKGQVFPSFVVPNFGFGVLDKYQTDAIVSSSDDKYSLHYRNDEAFVLGSNFRLFDGILKIGVNARIIDRTEINTSVSNTSTNLTVDNMASEGLGIGSDAGLLLTVPWAWLPTLSAVYRDIGNTSYNAGSGLSRNTSTKPQTTIHTMDVGLAVFPIAANHIRTSWTLEYRDVLTAVSEKDQLRRTHAGFEINFSDQFFLRAGLNERYWTAGLEFDVGHFQFQLGSYGEDVGTDPAHLEERRYDLKFAFRF